MVKPLMSGMHARVLILKIPLLTPWLYLSLEWLKDLLSGKMAPMTFHVMRWMPHNLLDLLEHRQDVIRLIQAQLIVSGPPQKRVQIWADCR